MRCCSEEIKQPMEDAGKKSSDILDSAIIHKIMMDTFVLDFTLQSGWDAICNIIRERLIAGDIR